VFQGDIAVVCKIAKRLFDDFAGDVLGLEKPANENHGVVGGTGIANTIAINEGQYRMQKPFDDIAFVFDYHI
jgi:hypothetical protein